VTILLSPGPIRVPAVIKRNMTLFALSQTFTGAGMQFAYGLGPLMVLAVTESPDLSGLSVAIMGISRFLVAYPVGRITDFHGRKPGILLGLMLAMVGTVILGFSVKADSLAMLVCGLLIFGMGMSASQQMRVAATDMFPSAMRAQALGYLAFGSLVGLVMSPIIIEFSEQMALRWDLHPLGLPWLLMPILILGGMALVGFVNPDPKEIGQNLSHYYPDHVPLRATITAEEKFSALVLLRDKSIRTAIILNSAATGNMAVNMVLTSLMLHHHGHSLSAIAVSHMFHTAGMFAFTIPIGWIADRTSRSKVMIGGAVVAALGAAIVTFVPAYSALTLGTFLVGLGWAGANVGSAALIADRCETVQRGRAIGLNDSFSSATTLVIALVTGPLIAVTSLEGASLMGMVVTLIPLAMIVWDRLSGPRN
jgi:MFS family permease